MQLNRAMLIANGAHDHCDFIYLIYDHDLSPITDKRKTGLVYAYEQHLCRMDDEDHFANV